MAQWLRAYSGDTHLSRVQDRELQLRHAIEIFRAKPTQLQREQYFKTVTHLAEQLHTARLQAAKARVAAIDPRDTEGLQKAQSKLARLNADGVKSVFAEFKLQDYEL